MFCSVLSRWLEGAQGGRLGLARCWLISANHATVAESFLDHHAYPLRVPDDAGEKSCRKEVRLVVAHPDHPVIADHRGEFTVLAILLISQGKGRSATARTADALVPAIVRVLI